VPLPGAVPPLGTAEEHRRLSRTKPVRARIGEEQGFTLFELLIVILIIGVLAEIAIPAFLGQASKANDAAAKSALHTAQTAIETYRLDHGDYCGAQASDLIAIEATLVTANALTVNACGGGDKNAYTLSVTSRSNYRTVYTVSVLDGVTDRSCSTPGQGGCAPGGTW
jgi:type IV pilus assembly protein PilA